MEVDCATCLQVGNSSQGCPVSSFRQFQMLDSGPCEPSILRVLILAATACVAAFVLARTPVTLGLLALRASSGRFGRVQLVCACDEKFRVMPATTTTAAQIITSTSSEPFSPWCEGTAEKQALGESRLWWQHDGKNALKEQTSQLYLFPKQDGVFACMAAGRGGSNLLS